MMNRTRLERNFIPKLDEPTTHFAMAIGHGLHVEGSVRIPANMYVIFMTRAGYLGSIVNASCPVFRRTFSNRTSIIKFLKGQTRNLPSVVTTKGWDWKKHIYPPRAIMQNFSLEMEQAVNNKPPNIRHVFSEFQSMVGVHIHKKQIWGRGTTKYIGEIMEHVSASVPEGHMVVLFVNGCRTSKNLANIMVKQGREIVPTPATLKRRGYHGQYTTRIHTPQNYPVSMSNITTRARNLNQIASGYMRKRSVIRVNRPPVKIGRGVAPQVRARGTPQPNVTGKKRARNNTNESPPPKRQFTKKTFENFKRNLNRGVPEAQLRLKYYENFFKFKKLIDTVNNLSKRLSKIKIY